MAKQFWVNNYFIDVNRNQIQHQQQATPIPPKALKVLEVLASRAGDVVSHDELMDIVWENSVVGPNTLQRAIAQLRKAFGDDSKKQAFIKTHAKKGYSLEANVRWANNELEQTVSEDVAPATKPNKLLTIAAVVLLMVIGAAFWPAEAPMFNQVKPLTASDEQEFNASYSPDGNYLVFNRYVGQCVSHLWAKDLNNNQEQRLSTKPGHYSQLSWSADGSQLAFVLQSDCSDKAEEYQQCWQLQTLDFAQAWNGKAENLLRYDCEGVKTTHPTWLNDGRIALLQYPAIDSTQPEIVIYDAVSDDLIQVPYKASGRIYSLDFSHQKELLATVSLEDDNSHVVRTLSLDGKLRDEAVITPLENQSVYAQFPVQFSPDGTHFLTHADGKIYRLNMEGDLALMHHASHTGLWTPNYHPSQERFAVTYGTKDFDIGYLNRQQAEADIETFSRSTSVDVNAKFQPNGDLISFVSRRSGDAQLWLIDGDKTFQLTNFEYGLKSSRYDWAPDGKKLAVNVNNQVALVEIDGTVEMIESPAAVDILMPWTSQNKILVTDNQTGQHTLLSIDLTSKQTTELAAQNVMWAAYNSESSVIYADHQTKVWQLENGKTQEITELNGEVFGNYLLLLEGQLYGINPQAELWRFNLATAELTSITAMDKNINYVSDIRDEQMLATKFIGGRRELMEFSQD